jgi:hypothetical protein
LHPRRTEVAGSAYGHGHMDCQSCANTQVRCTRGRRIVHLGEVATGVPGREEAAGRTSPPCLSWRWPPTQMRRSDAGELPEVLKRPGGIGRVARPTAHSLSRADRVNPTGSDGVGSRHSIGRRTSLLRNSVDAVGSIDARCGRSESANRSGGVPTHHRAHERSLER